MKILWVKSGGLLPLDEGGKIRSFGIARELARRHEVTLFTFYRATTPDPHRELANCFERVECLPLALPERASLRDVVGYAANALTSQPYQMRKYCRPEVARFLVEVLSKSKYDVLLCDYLLTAGVVPWSTSIPKVIFTHNVEATIWRRYFLLSKNPVWKFIAWREQRTITRAERHFLGLANHVLAVSEHDRSAFLEFLPQDKVTVVPTGVDLEYFCPSPLPERDHSLVFTGSMDWRPNEDAIIYFYRDILPLIREQIPDVTLSVVGRRPSRKLLALAEKDSAVRITGPVPDIRPHVQAAAVYVVPLRIGGGTRIKIFEAMAMGMAIVSTSIGAEGLPVQDGEHILLADRPEMFAARTVSLLTQNKLREHIGHAARLLVESYNWATVTTVVDEVLRRIVSKKKCDDRSRISIEEQAKDSVHDEIPLT